MAKSSTQTFYGTNNRKNQTHKTRRQVVEEFVDEWVDKDNYKQPDMTYSDFMDMFNKAKDSDQKKIQENGYAKPDNDSSSNSSNSSSSNSDSSEMSFDTAAQILQKGGFDDFNYERDSQTHDGSHATNNGGYLMMTCTPRVGNQLWGYFI